MLDLVGVSYSSIWNWIVDGTFPPGRALSDGKRGRIMWVELEFTIGSPCVPFDCPSTASRRRRDRILPRSPPRVRGSSQERGKNANRAGVRDRRGKERKEYDYVECSKKKTITVGSGPKTPAQRTL